MSATDAFGYETNVTAASMFSFAEALRKIAAQHEAIGNLMQTAEIQGVRAKNLTMACGALVALGKFTGNVTTAYCDELSAAGVSELEGGMSQLRRYLKRTSESLAGPLTPKESAAQAIKEHVGRGASRGASKPKTQ